MPKHLFAWLSGFGMTGLAIIPFYVSPEHITWMRWRIAIISFALIALAGLALQLYFQQREERKGKREQQERERQQEEREEERERKQEERDTKLVAKVIAEYQASLEKVEGHPKEKPPSRMTHDSAFMANMDSNDPRIYLDIEPAPENMFRRTPFILHNQGKETAHNVSIQPFKLSRKRVTFPAVAVIPAGDKRSTLPTIEGGIGPMLNHDIFYWLMKDWNDNGELVEEWPIPISLRYGDPLDQKSFESTMTLVFHPIRHMMNNRHERREEPPFLKRERDPSWEFRDIKFKRTNLSR